MTPKTDPKDRDALLYLLGLIRIYSDSEPADDER